MCTWAMLETISYFLQRESDVFLCSMDKTKAFDLVRYGTLFKKMKEKVGPVFMRLIIFIYTNQICRVFFNNKESSEFKILNGVGQGKILAGFAYCFYCDDLFNILGRSGFGCRIEDTYAGMYGYSDDDVLLAPSQSALQSMVDITSEFCRTTA